MINDWVEVTHRSFSLAVDGVTEGFYRLAILTAYRTIIIDKKTIEKFAKAGRAVIKPDSDGKGFRVASGKRYNYVFAGQLFVIAK